jgi:hypothetical protein
MWIRDIVEGILDDKHYRIRSIAAKRSAGQLDIELGARFLHHTSRWIRKLRETDCTLYTCDAHPIIDIIKLGMTVSIRRRSSSDPFHEDVQFDHKQTVSSMV